MTNFGKAMMVAGYCGAYDRHNPYTRRDAMPTVPGRGFDLWCRCVHAFAAKHIADQYGYEVEAA